MEAHDSNDTVITHIAALGIENIHRLHEIRPHVDYLISTCNISAWIWRRENTLLPEDFNAMYYVLLIIFVALTFFGLPCRICNVSCSDFCRC